MKNITIYIPCVYKHTLEVPDDVETESDAIAFMINEGIGWDEGEYEYMDSESCFFGEEE